VRYTCMAVFCLVAVGCAETKVSDGTGNPLSGSSRSSSNASGKPYLSEILRRYSTPGDAAQPFGLWTLTQTTTSGNGKLTVDGFLRINKESVSNIVACLDNESKKYVIAPAMATVALVKNSDGSYSFNIPRPIENEAESNGLTCRSSLKEGEYILKVDERGMLLIKEAGDVQFAEFQRVK